MNGEVVDALFGLFDEGVPEEFPGEVFGDAIDFFEGLVDGYGAEGYGGVTENPFACFVDVFSCGEVHDRVGSPAGGPDHFFDFFFDGGGDGGVADVGIDFDGEVAADDHRLEFGVVDVGGDNGAAAGDFVAYVFSGDAFGKVGAEVVAGVLFFEFGEGFFDFLVFTDGNVFHFGGDYALSGVVHLGDAAALFRTEHGAIAVETEGVERFIGFAFASV